MIRISYTKYITFEEFKKQFSDDFQYSSPELKEKVMRKHYDKVNPKQEEPAPEVTVPVVIEKFDDGSGTVVEEKPKRNRS